MDINNLTQIILNFSQSLGPIQILISALAYLLGLIFIITAIFKLHSIGSVGAPANERVFVPIAYLIGGGVLIFAPTAFKALSATVFGSTSILQYAALNPVNVTAAIILIIQTAGLVWFVRGCVLLVSASQPGVQEGPKGMVFLCAGILAMNFEATIAAINAILAEIFSYTLHMQ